MRTTGSWGDEIVSLILITLINIQPVLSLPGPLHHDGEPMNDYGGKAPQYGSQHSRDAPEQPIWQEREFHDQPLLY